MIVGMPHPAQALRSAHSPSQGDLSQGPRMEARTASTLRPNGKESSMIRPKSDDRPLSLRMPVELKQDLHEAAERLDRADSEFVKECLEFKLKLAWVMQADWYKLRRLDPRTLRVLRMTVSDEPAQPEEDLSWNAC